MKVKMPNSDKRTDHITFHEAEQADTLLSQRLDSVLEQMEIRAKLLQNELDQRFDSVQLQINRRFDAIQLQIDQRFLAAETAVITSLASAEKAVSKAEASSEKRFEGVNEFRATLSDQARSFPTREEVNAQFAAVASTTVRNTEALREIELRLTSRLDTIGGRESGIEANRVDAREDRSEQKQNTAQILQAFALVVIGIGVMVSIVALLLHK